MVGAINGIISQYGGGLRSPPCLFANVKCFKSIDLANAVILVSVLFCEDEDVEAKLAGMLGSWTFQ